MFFGEYAHTLDAKNRLFIPAPFRDELGGRFIICKSSLNDHCLYIYTEKRFEEVCKDIKEKLTLSQQRFALMGVMAAESDKSGRITVSQKLCDYAGLKKNVVIYGVYDRIEVWDEERWYEAAAAAEKDSAGGDMPLIRY